MLVVKRALNLTISFVLVHAPTLAFAKQKASRHHSRFVAEERETRATNSKVDLGQQQQSRTKHDKHEARNAKPDAHNVKQEARALKREARHDKREQFKETKHAHRTGLEQYKDMSDALHDGFRPVKVRGKNLRMMQTPGVNGRARVQVTQGDDYREILVDENNNGTASRWEITRGNTTFVAKNPLYGGFQNLEMEEKRAGGTVKVFMSLNLDWKTYRVTRIQFVPFKATLDGDAEDLKTQNLDKERVAAHAVSAVSAISVAVGSAVSGTTKNILNKVHIGDAESLKNNKCIDDQVSRAKEYIEELMKETGKTKEAALQCKMNRFKNYYIDPSCSDGKFAKPDSSEAIANAMAKVFASIDTPDAKPPRYLQCLSSHSFAFHSAQIQANVSQYAQSKVALNLEKPEDKNKCDILPIAPERAAQLFTEKSPRLFTCSMPKHLQAEAGKDIADYRNDGTNQIVFNENAATTLKRLQKTTPKLKTPEDAYAMLIVHEMLHQSGIRSADNESLVLDLEHCCAEPNSPTDSSNPACARVDKYVESQKYLNLSSTDFDHYWPGFAGLRSAAEKALSVDGSNGVTDKFMAQMVADLRDDRDVQPAYTRMKSCINEPGSNPVTCQVQFADNYAEDLRRITKKNCEAVEKEVSDRGVNCGELAKAAEKSLAEGAQMPEQIVVSKTKTVTIDNPRALDGDGEDQGSYKAINVPDLPLPKMRYDDVKASLPDLASLSPSTSKRAKNTKPAAAQPVAAQPAAARPTTAKPTSAQTNGATNANADGSTGPDIVVVARPLPKNSPTPAPTTSVSSRGDEPARVSVRGGLSEGLKPETDGTDQSADKQPQDSASQSANENGLAPNAGGFSLGSSNGSSAAQNIGYSSQPMAPFAQGVSGTTDSRVDGLDPKKGVQTASNLISGTESLLGRAANRVAPTLAAIGLGSAVAQAAPPPQESTQTLTQAQANAGYRNSGGGDREPASRSAPAPVAAKAGAVANDQDAPSAIRAAQPLDEKAQAAAIDKFEAQQSSGTTDFVAKLRDLATRFGRGGAQRLEDQLLDPTSKLSNLARANNLVPFRDRDGSLILRNRNPKIRQCYKADPRVILRPASCG